MSHNSKLPFEVQTQYPDYWDWAVHNVVSHIKNWFEIVLRDARMHKVPTIFVRYEDLVVNPRPELEKIMKFLVNLVDLQGTNAERKIDQVLT